MSLIGIRDMSVLEEPPMDRVPDVYKRQVKNSPLIKKGDFENESNTYYRY